GINNCDWAKAAREGRVPVCGQACDHYHRYEEDFDIAKSLGHNVHRFSLEWARIEPEEGKFNLEEIEHYRQVLSALKARGLTPIVTLWHFTLPLWFFESGGFERKDAPEIFARYARFIAQQLGSELGVVSTINEPIVFAGLGWLKGNWPPFKQHPFVTDTNQLTNSGDRSKARPSH
ncbi:glycoside hydrolase family 1 protein, partial [Candidatus Kaiserbacteria bacterium]|nr:glycoside hydrolase family 1 protein [Candidatus Kaiserbacteria bacterium]